MDYERLPNGFAMALSRNFPALNAWSSMTEEQKQMVADRVRSAGSREEIHHIVNSLTGRLPD